MRAWWRRFKDRILNDEAFFTSVVRSTIATAATSGLAFAQQVADVFGGDARAVVAIRGASVIAMGFALFMRAGDKNEGDDELRERLERLGVATAPPPPGEPAP